MPESEARFSDRLTASIEDRRSVVCVGLDPSIEAMPPAFVAGTAAGATQAAKDALDDAGEAAAAACCSAYCRQIIAAVAPFAAAVKPQAAFFEQYGAPGWRALIEVVRCARAHDLPVIVDVKRADIASTAEAYANAVFGGAAVPGGGVAAGLGADAVTVNPYLGTDSLRPFVARCSAGHGVFVLTRTSNPGAADLQERRVVRRSPTEHGAVEGPVSHTQLYRVVAELVAGLAEEHLGVRGYSDVGVVAGATAPAALAAVRELVPRSFILVPGVGAQGGRIETLRAAAAGEAGGLVVNSSRGILYAWRQRGGDFRAAAAEACAELRDQLTEVLWS